MRVLVTGGTGFVGSHITRQLRASGHDVRLLARTPSKVAPLMDRMGVDATALEVFEGDITDDASVAASVDGCDAVVHAAAVVATDSTKDDEMDRVNLLGAQNVLGSATTAGCDPVIDISSVAALFPFRTNPVTADHPVVGANNGYGRSKAACERFARGLQDEGHPVVLIYPSGIVGPDDWTESIQIQQWKLWLQTGFPRSRGSAGSWVDVRDIALVVDASMRTGEGPKRLLAMGTFLTAHDHVDAMSAALGTKARSFPLPQPVWWVWGKLGDLARRVGRDLVLTSDGYDYLFKSVPGDGAPTEAATGVTFRPVEETFADTIRWLVGAGHVPADKAGRLVD